MEEDGDAGAAGLEIPGVSSSEPTFSPDDEGIKLLPDSDESSDSSSDDSEEKKKLDKATRKRLRSEKKRVQQDRQAALQQKWDAKEDIPFKRGKILFEHQFPTEPGNALLLREFKGAELCKGAPVYLAFPSKGLSGVLVAKTLIDELGLPLVGELAARGFTTAVRVHHGVASHICRLYGDARIAVVVSELQMDAVTAHACSDAVRLWCERRGSRLVLASEGLPDEVQLDLEEDEKVDQELVVQKLIETLHLDDDSEDGEKKRAAHHRRRHAHALRHHAAHVRAGKEGKEGKDGGGDKKKKGAKVEVEEEGDDAANDDGWEDADSSAPPSPEARVAKRNSVKAAGRTLFLTTSAEIDKSLLALGLHRIKNAIVAGVTGVLFAEAGTTDDLDVALIVAKYHPLLGDARAALAILDAIVGLVKTVTLQVKYSELKEHANAMEFRVKKGLGKMSKAAQGKAPTGMYM